MDYNTYGAKKKLIEQYFSSFLPNEENNIWEVRLSEVISDFNEKELDNSSQIRSVQITLDLSKNQYDFLKENNTQYQVLRYQHPWFLLRGSDRF